MFNVCDDVKNTQLFGRLSSVPAISLVKESAYIYVLCSNITND